MSTYGTDGGSFPGDTGKLQLAVATQLFKAVATMHHIDELFQWLAYTIVQRYDVQLAQFWTPHTDWASQPSTQLRTIVRQDPSLPEQIVVNERIAATIQRIFSEQRSYAPQPVEEMFSHYQASLLRRYGLNYCTGCFRNSSVFLLPAATTVPYEQTPIPFAIVALLILRQAPHRNFMPTIDATLERAVAMAGSRGLLLPTPTAPRLPTPQASLQQKPSPALSELIPHRTQENDLLVSSNPFASSGTISDKQARRLYAAIDGHKNIAELCNSTDMDMKEVYAALQTLLAQHRIELYEPDGQLVDESFSQKREL